MKNDKLKFLIDQLNNVECAFIFGSIADKKENINSDVDLMLIGSADQNLLINEISRIEGEIGREINYQIYSPAEILKKLKERKKKKRVIKTMLQIEFKNKNLPKLKIL